MSDLVVGRLTIPAVELDERFTTSGGPGGQHANRTESAVTLRFHVAESSMPEPEKTLLLERLGDMIEVRAADSRSQAHNREIARQRLARQIEAALVEPKERKKTKPTKGGRERRLAEKKARAETKKQRRRPEIE